MEDLSKVLTWTLVVLQGVLMISGQHYREEYSPRYRTVEYSPQYRTEYRSEYSPSQYSSRAEYSPQYRSEYQSDYSSQYRNGGSSSSSSSRDPCLENPCGQGALCEVRNEVAICKCPPDYLGNAFTRCYPECTSHEECAGHQACFGLRCKDPCAGACGRNANCNVNRHKAVCSCPKDHTGHPFDECRPFTPTDLCYPRNPCGTNANCQPGHDNSGKERPVCTCPTGYSGDPLRYCYAV